jgi:leader peptidase (prepilin peptidase)/N-methyltransferase
MMILVFVVGLFLGTLINFVIVRLPRERDLLRWPPRCTRTGEPLALWQLLPLAGWLLQRGRARDGRRLHWIYPLVELLTALVLALLYQQHGFAAMFFYLAFVCVVLILTGAIDWLHRWIYTFVMLGSAAVVLLLNIAIGFLHPLDSLSGAVAAGIVFILLWFLGRLLFPATSVPFGMGDVYLGIFIGAAVGLVNLGAAVLYGVFMAGFVAALLVAAKHLFGRKDVPQYISYGSYLCLGAVVYIVLIGLQ